MATLKKRGKLPEEAAAIIFQALADGTLLGRAKQMRTIYMGEKAQEDTNQIVPAGLLALGPIPPLGHPFWTVGDIRVTPDPLPDGSVVQIGGETISCRLGGSLPVYIIRGLRFPRDGVLALSRAIGRAKGRGRPKGAGSLALADEALTLEMHELVRSGAASSASRAASKVVSKALGDGSPEAKIKRLVKRYFERFPQR